MKRAAFALPPLLVSFAAYVEHHFKPRIHRVSTASDEMQVRLLALERQFVSLRGMERPSLSRSPSCSTVISEIL